MTTPSKSTARKAPSASTSLTSPFSNSSTTPCRAAKKAGGKSPAPPAPTPTPASTGPPTTPSATPKPSSTPPPTSWKTSPAKRPGRATPSTPTSKTASSARKSSKPSPSPPKSVAGSTSRNSHDLTKLILSRAPGYTAQPEPGQTEPIGEMSEWLKERDWKSRCPDEGHEGSNPSLSVENPLPTRVFALLPPRSSGCQPQKEHFVTEPVTSLGGFSTIDI